MKDAQGRRRRAPIDVEGGAAPTGLEYRLATDIVDRSGLVPFLQPYVDADAGRPRTLPVRALLVAMMVNALRQDHVGVLVRVTRVMNSFSPGQRRSLGIEGWPERGSYHRVQRLFQDVAAALAIARLEQAGEVIAVGTDALNLLVEASCPDDLPRSRSVAIDGTPLPSWGCLRGDEETVELDLEEELDELPDELRNRETPKPRRGKKKAKVLDTGEDGRNVYTADPTARAGWRTATNSRPAGPYIGREAHLMVQVADLVWSNGRDLARVGPRVPALVRGFSSVPAGTHRGKTATALLRSALRRGADIDDVLVDPGYSMAKPEFFLLPTRREGLHVTFRPASYQWKVRPYNDDAVTIGGQLFDASVPDKLLELKMPSRGDDPETKLARQEAYDERAAFAYRPHAGPDADGTTRWASPFAVRSLHSEQAPESLRGPRTTPLVDLDGRAAPPKTLSVNAGDLPLQQRLIAGTTAHTISMNRRNAVEGANGNLKNNFTDVERGYTRVFGNEKVALMLAFTLAGLNAFIAASFRRLQKAERERASLPRRRERRRKNTYDAVLGPDAATSGEGRAPP